MRAAILLLIVFPLAAMEPVHSDFTGVKRIYVESLGGTPAAMMLRDMIVSSIASCGLFTVTETADRADAVLRGSASDQLFTDEHRSTDSITAGVRLSNSESFSVKNSRSSESQSSGLNIGQNESMTSSERRHEASASVRLVNRDGDVIWSTTQESLGAKFKSSSADVAEKIYRKLMDDYRKANSASTQAGTPTR